MTLITGGYLYNKLNRINTLFYLVQVYRKFNGQKVLIVVLCVKMINF